MHTPHTHAHRGAVSLLVAVSLLAALVAGPARAWQYPLLPHVNGLAFFPETPNTASNVTAELSAYYLNECWQLVEADSVDSAHVRVTIQRVGACPESVSTWTHRFNLGTFTAGMHDLTVHCTVRDGSEPPGEEEITVDRKSVV